MRVAFFPSIKRVWQRLNILGVSACSFVLLAVFAYAQVDDTPKSLVLKRFNELRSGMQGLTSIHVKGKYSIEYSPDFIKGAHLAVLSRNYTTELWMQGSDIRFEQQELGENRGPAKTVDLLTDGHFYCTTFGQTTFATVTSDMNGPSIHKIFDQIVPLFGFSFLSTSSTDRGIFPLTIQSLTQPALWNEILSEDSLDAISNAGDKVLTTVKNKNNWWNVTLIKSQTPSGLSYLPSEIAFYTHVNGKDSLVRKLVIEHSIFKDGVGPIVTKASLEYYHVAPDFLVATYHYDLDQVDINPSIPENTFPFDPSLVDKIYDAQSKTLIEVPR